MDGFGTTTGIQKISSKNMIYVVQYCIYCCIFSVGEIIQCLVYIGICISLRALRNQKLVQ